MPVPDNMRGIIERAVAAGFGLDRRRAVPALISRHQDFLIVSGLAGTSRDVAAPTDDGAHGYTMAGAMGGAAMIGLGLALAPPDKRALVVTGDGELLNIGALATIAVKNPANLAILCVDNGHYGEIGYQRSHTSLGVDLEKIAIGAGNGIAFVVLRVRPTDPPVYKRNMDPALCRDRFRAALLGAG